MTTYGLIGHPLSHSFSPGYFNSKFEKEKIDAVYKLFDMNDLDMIDEMIHSENPVGLNVTIPYKTKVLNYLHAIDRQAAEVGAVNTIKVQNGMLTGYNTDVYGFIKSLQNWLGINIPPALVLGSGGASKAVTFGLRQLGIPFLLVSRTPHKGNLSYQQIDKQVLTDNQLIINTTPLGMAPDTDSSPKLPFELLCAKNLIYDLVYNPEETLLMKKAKKRGAKVKNGLEMLRLQAEKSWEIWTV